MEEEVKFKLFHFSKDGVKQSEFETTFYFDQSELFLNVNFHRLMSHVRCKVDQNSCVVNLENSIPNYFQQVLYIGLDGRHVPLNYTADDFRVFLDFVRRDKEAGHNHIHLIVPESKEMEFMQIGEKSVPTKMEKKLEFKDLERLFSKKIDTNLSVKIEEAAQNLSANVFVQEAPPSEESKQNERKPQKGVFNVQRITNNSAMDLFRNGTQILVPTGDDDDFLLMSLSKNDWCDVYKFFLWQNRNQKDRFCEYRCQEMRMPVVIEKDSTIRVSEESKNLIGNIVNLCERSRMRACEHSEDLSDMVDSNYSSSVEFCDALVSKDVPFWFHNYMSVFLKNSIVAEIKKDVRSILQARDDQQEKEEEIPWDSTLNYLRDTVETMTKSTKKEWEFVELSSNGELDASLNESCKPDQPSTSAVDDSKQETEYEQIEVKNAATIDSTIVTGSSEYVIAECDNDSDSSLSLILDACSDSEEFQKLELVAIPRCFIPQSVDITHIPEDTNSVPFRVKRVSRDRKSASSMMGSSSESLEVSSKMVDVTETRLTLDSPVPKANVANAEVLDITDLLVPGTYERDTTHQYYKNVTVDNLNSVSADGCASGASPKNEDVAPTNTPVLRLRLEKDNAELIEAEVADSVSSNVENDTNDYKRFNILPERVFEMSQNVITNAIKTVKAATNLKKKYSEKTRSCYENVQNPVSYTDEVMEQLNNIVEDAFRFIPNPLISQVVPDDEKGNSSTQTASQDMDQRPSIQSGYSRRSRFLRGGRRPHRRLANQRPRPSMAVTVNDTTNPTEPEHSMNNSTNPAGSEHNYFIPEELPEETKKQMLSLQEMGFLNSAHNLFLLRQYPDDFERVVESLVNFF